MQNSTDGSTLNEHQIYRNGRSQRNHFDRGDEQRRKGGYGVHHRNQGEHDPAVYPRGIRGDLHVTLEGTWAAWLHDLLKPHVTEPVPVAVSSLLRMQQGDAVDARMLLLSEQGFASVTVTADAEYAESGNGCSATCH